MSGGARRYRFAFDPEAEADLAALTRRDRTTVLDAMDEQLRDQPDVPTRNRSRTRPNPYGEWRLRVPPYRVYYDVEGDTVYINAVFYKPRERSYRRGREVQLDD